MSSDIPLPSTPSYHDVSRRSSNMSTISSSSRSISRVDQILSKSQSTSIKAAIVIEFGNALTKVGMAGEFAPRRVIRSEVIMSNEIEPTPVFNNEYSDERQKDLLLAFMKKIAFNILILPFKDRNVVIVLRVLGNERLQNILMDILKKNTCFLVQEIKFISSQIAASIASYCTEVGLVVDVGCEFSSIFPVIFNSVVVHEGETSMSCSKSLELNVRNLLLKYCSVRMHETQEIKKVDEEILSILDKTRTYENICNKYLFVTTLERSRKLENFDSLTPQPKDVEMIYKDFTLIVTGRVREVAAEILFTTAMDSLSIPEAILDCIHNCPIDYRRELFGKLIVVGGVTEMPGFLGRLRAELIDAISCPEYKSLGGLETPKFIRYPTSNLSTGLILNWIGGSLYANSSF
uniref:Actin-related protein 10 n=1 Tax=Parastrongyloides trichosuri TaxID=131310 RepID=A0A0N4ZK29_PARTI